MGWYVYTYSGLYGVVRVHIFRVVWDGTCTHIPGCMGWYVYTYSGLYGMARVHIFQVVWGGGWDERKGDSNSNCRGIFLASFISHQGKTNDTSH
jgi:hypothetical protein